jgi:hypothetical protein
MPLALAVIRQLVAQARLGGAPTGLFESQRHVGWDPATAVEHHSVFSSMAQCGHDDMTTCGQERRI